MIFKQKPKFGLKRFWNIHRNVGTFKHNDILDSKKSGKTSAPVFFLILELLLFIVIFLLFLIRWYLSASILSDPGRALGAPRRFLYEKQRGENG